MELFERLEIDRNILEQTNPIFNTAKMTLFMLAETGNEDAKTLVDELGLTYEETQNSRSHVNSKENHIADLINIETRFRTMGVLAQESGCDVCIDLPCGYTPRAAEFARKGIRFVGLDLPAAIEEAEPAICSLMSEEERKLVTFKAVDATNYASLEEALEGVKGSICITTEGLLFYLAEPEVEQLCANIRRILLEHGGCWITCDPEVTLIYITLLKIICGDRFMEILMQSNDRTVEKSDVKLGLNPITVRPQDVEKSMGEAMAFLAKRGLKMERVIVADHMPELVTAAKLGPEGVAAYKEAMKNFAYWKITLLEGAQKLDASMADSQQFKATAEISEDTLRLGLQGRLDTISSPGLLALFEKHKDEINSVEIDCAGLEYISSAGLRVLLVMVKSCKGGVSLTNVSDFVRSVIAQTGLAPFVTYK